MPDRSRALVDAFTDRSLFNIGEITMPAGDLATAIRMRSAEFGRIADPRMGDFAGPEALLKGGLKIPRRKAGGAAGSQLASGR